MQSMATKPPKRFLFTTQVQHNTSAIVSLSRLLVTQFRFCHLQTMCVLYICVVCVCCVCVCTGPIQGLRFLGHFLCCLYRPDTRPQVARPLSMLSVQARYKASGHSATFYVVCTGPIQGLRSLGHILCCLYRPDTRPQVARPLSMLSVQAQYKASGHSATFYIVCTGPIQGLRSLGHFLCCLYRPDTRPQVARPLSMLSILAKELDH